MKIKEILLYFLLIAIILFSFLLPPLVSNWEERRLLAKCYTVNRETPTLNSELQNLEFIHTLYSRYSTTVKYEVTISDISETKEQSRKNSQAPKHLLAHINELIECNLIDETFLSRLLKEENTIYRIWDYDNGSITYSRTKIFVSSNSYHIALASVEIENVTNRIIAMTLPKQYVTISKASFEKYANYLGLKNIKDWQYENNQLTSNSGQIKIVCTINDENSSIKVLPLDVAT